MARGDVRKGKKGNAQQAGAHVETEQRAVDIGRHVAVGEHCALGSSGGAGSVDDGGKIAGLDGAGEGFGLRVEGLRALGELIHERAGGGYFGGELNVIHDHDLLNLRVGENCLDLAQLLFGGDENYGGAGVAQGVGGLFGG